VKSLAPLAICVFLAGCTTCGPVRLNTGGGGGKVIDSHMAAYLAPGARITTANPMLFHIKDEQERPADYWVLLAPNPGSKTPASGGRHNSRTTFAVGNGYALYWGLWPIGTDGTEDTSADGTTFVIQSDGNRLHRSFLLSNPTGKAVHVSLTGTDPNLGKVMTQPGSYIEVRYDERGKASLSDPLKTDLNPETRDFITAVKKEAVAQGFKPEDLE
jgi:hypothetical protein